MRRTTGWNASTAKIARGPISWVSGTRTTATWHTSSVGSPRNCGTCRARSRRSRRSRLGFSPRTMSCTSATISPRWVSSTRRTVLTRSPSPHECPRSNRRFAHLLQRLHDLRLVRASPQSADGAVARCRRHQLGHRVLRVSPPGAGQPDRLYHAAAVAAQSDAGSDRPGGVRTLRYLLHEAADQAGLPLGGAVPDGSGVL